MKPQRLYGAVFGIWGFFASLVIGWVLGAFAAGAVFFVLFVTGESRLERWLGVAFGTAYILGILGISGTAIYNGYRYGNRHQEAHDTRRAKVHLVFSVLALMVFLVSVVVYAVAAS